MSMLKNFSEDDVRGIWLAGLLILLVSIILVGIGLKMFVWPAPSYDKKTFCVDELEKPLHAIFLVDTSDELSAFQLDYIRNDIRRIGVDSDSGSRFTFHKLDRKFGGVSEPVFDMCKPRDGSDMSILYEAPEKAKKAFSKNFEIPLRELAQSFGDDLSQSKSPIVEAISDLGKLGLIDESAKEIKLRVYSDMLQNSNSHSVFSGQSIPASGCASELFLEVSVHVLEPAAKHQSLQSDTLIESWAKFFGSCTTKQVSCERVRR